MTRRIVTMYIVLVVAVLLAQAFGWLDDMTPPVEIGRSV
jgi:hypothetical protein